MDDKCAWCGYNTRKNGQAYSARRKLEGPAWKWYRDYLNTFENCSEVTEDSIICNKCRIKLVKVRENQEANENVRQQRKPRLDFEGEDGLSDQEYHVDRMDS